MYLEVLGVKLGVRNERKGVSRMWENVYLSIKNPKASRALKQAPDPGRICACFTHATSLHDVGILLRKQSLLPPLPGLDLLLYRHASHKFPVICRIFAYTLIILKVLQSLPITLAWPMKDLSVQRGGGHMSPLRMMHWTSPYRDPSGPAPPCTGTLLVTSDGQD